MYIKKQLDLTTFEFWSGAKQHRFTFDELREIEYILEDLYSDNEPTETTINDLFWFEDEYLCECIGVNYDEYLNR